MLHDYDEFNRFVDHSLPIIKEMVDKESDSKNGLREAYENIKTVGLQLHSKRADVTISLGHRDEVQIIENLRLTLVILEELQQEVEKIHDDGITDLLFKLGINYIHSTIERIVIKITD
jgi:hypothetical protein